MIRSHHAPEPSPFPDLTALLDLVFIVMVFLLLTTNIAVKSMDVALPQTDQSDVLRSPQQNVITINLLAHEPYWALEGTQYSDWSNFTSALLSAVKRSPDNSLIIAADKSASVETMLQLLAFLQKNQINATNIMMEDSQP